MTMRIVTDSTCDLPARLAEENAITVIPCYINMENQSYLDEVQLSRQQFYERIPFLRSHPTTSAPGIGTFVEIYTKLATEGANDIISIHVSGTLSNIPSIARMAAGVLDGIQVNVIDGGQLSLGTGFLALTAAKAARRGCPIQEIIEMIDDQKARTYAFAALETLDYLRRSGRVSTLQSSLGSLLQIKPILTIHEGKVRLERVRTHKSAMMRLVDMVRNLYPMERIALLHTHASNEAERLRDMVRPYLPNDDDILFAEATTILGVHFGPGAVGCVCIKAPQAYQKLDDHMQL
jgi:DegV family protein with EDD domain